jgi:hypothetical protein
MAKYEYAPYAATNAKAYRDYLAKHPQQRAIPLTRAQLEAICRDLEAYADLYADATAWAEQATRSAARIAELEAERELIRMLEAQNGRLLKIERLANRYRDCEKEFPNDADACAEWADALDAALVGAPFGPDVAVARGMAIVQRVIAEQGGEA